MKRLNILSKTFLLIFGITFSACTVGLGPAVDTNPPAVTITSPSSNTAVGSASGDAETGLVTFTGTYSDDKAIKSIEVSLYLRDDSSSDRTKIGDSVTITSESSGRGAITADESNPKSGTWSYQIDTSVLKDGSYTLSVVGYDGYYKSGEIERNFYVDNTAPVLLLTSPGSSNADSPEENGTALGLAAEIYEEHEVSSLSVQYFDAGGNPIKFTGLLDKDSNVLPETDTITYTDISVSGSTSLTLAAQSSNDSYEEKNYNTIYETLYKSTDSAKVAAQDGKVYIYVYVEACDSVGNKSVCSWSKKELLLKLRDQESVSVTSLHEELSKYKNDSSYSSDILTALNQTKCGLAEGSGDTDDEIFKNRKLYSVSINKSVNPSYSFANTFVVNSSMDLTSWQGVQIKGSMTFNVKAGLNGDGITPNTLKVNIYKVKTDAASWEKGDLFTSLDCTSIYNGKSNLDGITTGVTEAAYTFNLPDLSEYGQSYYIIEVTGQDSAGRNLESISNVVYGFKSNPNNTIPSISKVSAYLADSEENLENAGITELGTNTVVGGSKKRYLKFRVEASRNSSSKSLDVTLNFAGKTYTLTEKTAGIFTSEGIDLKSVTTNAYTALVTATLAKGEETEASVSAQKTISVNNAGPLIAFSTPAKDDTYTYTGEINFSGTASSSYSTVESVKCKVVDNDSWDTYKSGSEEEKIALVESSDQANTGKATLWKFKFTPFATSEVEKYSSLSHTQEGVYTLPVMFLATDDLGNKTVVSDYSILYDPYADRPSAEIVYPSAGTKVSGSIRLSGSATDNNGSVREVYIQIDTNKDGKFDSADAANLRALTDEDGSQIYEIVTVDNLKNSYGDSVDLTADPGSFWGIKVTNTKSWYYTINSHDELEKLTGAKASTDSSDEKSIYEFAVRVTALDNNYILGRWSDAVKFTVDPDAPVIEYTKATVQQFSSSDFEAGNYSNPLAKRAYVEGMSLRGDWYLVVEAHDASGIYTKSSCYYEASSAEALNSTSKKTLKYISYTDGSESGIRVYIPLNTGKVNTEGEKYIKLFVEDSADESTETDRISSEQTFMVSYDNNAPVVKANNGPDFTGYLSDVSGYALAGQKLKVSNNTTTISGSVNDEGSGFDKALYYLRRVLTEGDVTTTTIELPLPKVEDSETFTSDRSMAAVYKVSENEISKAASDAYEKKVYKDSDSGLYGVKLTGATRKSTEFTHALAGKYTFIRAGGLVYISGSYYRIKSVSGNTVTFEEEIDTSFTEAFFPMAFVVDDPSGNESSYWNEGVNTIKNDDGDGIFESISIGSSSKNWVWKSNFYADELDDGPVYIDTMVMDVAGNCSEVKETYVMLANHTPRISKVYVGVDINRNNYIENDELGTSTVNGAKVNYYLAADTSAVAQVVTLAQTDIKMTGNLVVAVEMLGDKDFSGYGGGNNTLYYKANLSKEKLTSPEVSGDMITFENNSLAVFKDENLEGLNKVYFPADDYMADGEKALEDGDGYFINLSIADTTSGITLGQEDDTSVKNNITYYKTFGSQATAINIPLVIDLADEVAPLSNVADLYWNSAKDNSLYQNSLDNGHLEMPEDLPAAKFNQTSGEFDRDAKVSGQISLTGSAYDDQLLDSIWVCIENKELTNYLSDAPESEFGSNSDSIGKIEMNNSAYICYQVAQYLSSGANWTCASASMTNDGYAFSIISSSMSQAGHSAEWRLDIDTAKIIGTGADVNVRVLVVDHAKNTSLLGSDDSEGTSACQMDVVPYVTSLTTKLTNKNPNVPSEFGRSALGAYPVYAYTRSSATTVKSQTEINYATDYEKVTVNGFNLAKGAKITLTGAELSLDENMQFSLTGDVSSGAMEVTVGEMQALNNVNNNYAKGGAKDSGGNVITVTNSSSYKEKSTYAYNLQPNNTNNNLLTDDLEIAVIQLDSMAARSNIGAIEEPVMKVNPANGLLGFAYASGNDKFYMAGNKISSYQLWGVDKDHFKNIAFAYDSAGNSYGMAAGTDSGGNYSNMFRFHTDVWGISNGAGSNNNARRLERLGYKDDDEEKFYLDIDRISSPVLAVSSASDDLTNVYLAYYDRQAAEIRFRAGALDKSKNPNKNFGQFYDEATGSTFGTLYNYDYLSVISDADYGMGTLSGKGNENASAMPGNYVSLAVIPGTDTTKDVSVGDYIYQYNSTSKSIKTSDVVLAVWYDMYNQTVWYSYNADPFNVSNCKKPDENNSGAPKLNYNWAEPKAIITGDAGGACAVAVDKNNGVHIAVYSSLDGLVYTYMSSYNAETFEQYKVDADTMAGERLTLDVALDANKKPVPYIGYYSISADYPKIAYLVDASDRSSGCDEQGMVTQKWETYVVPTNSKLTKDKVNIGVYKDASTGVIKNFATGSNTMAIENAGMIWQGNAEQNYSKTYANGTVNPVAAYGIKVGSRGYIETAQKK